MTKQQTKAPTSAEVSRGRMAVQQELADAKQAHDEAAFEAASSPGSEAAREKLANARRRVGVLQSELEGLEAVGRVASRREKVRHIEQQIQDAEAERNRAIALVDAVEPAFARVCKAIEELGMACDELQQAERAANRAEAAVAPMPNGWTFYPEAHKCTPLRDALLWLAFVGKEMPEMERSEVVMTTGGQPTPGRPAEVLRAQSEKARHNIERGTAVAVAKLQEQLQALAQAGEIQGVRA